MRTVKILLVSLLMLVMVGCNNEVTEEEFMDNTTFKVSMLEAQFIDDDAMDDFIEGFNEDNNGYYKAEYDEVKSTLDNIEHLVVDEFTATDGKTYVFVPIFQYLQFVNAEASYSYRDGILTIDVVATARTFPMSDVQLVVIEIDSEYEYEVEVNLEIE